MDSRLDNYFKRPVGLIIICFVKAVWGMSQMILGLGAIILVWVVGWAAKADFWQKIFFRFDLRGIFEVSSSFGWLVFLLGLVDFAIAFGIWFGSWAIRNIGLVFFSGLTVWSLYKISVDFSLFKVLVLLFDFFTLFYFWQILPKDLKKK